MDGVDDDVAQIVSAILASPKYRNISREFIAAVARQELRKRRNSKEAVKAVKNKLHQVAGVYFGNNAGYGLWLDELRGLQAAGNQEDFRLACRRMMAHHASTRERLPILEQFYSTIFANLPEVRTVLDIACGFNPLCIPWMDQASDTQYYAYDIYYDLADFLTEFFRLVDVQGIAETRDVISDPPTQTADVAFLLKSIPCLEQTGKSAGIELMRAIDAPHLVVSFPAHSLSGRSKGMVANYEMRFRELIQGERWSIKRLEFATELVFIVHK